MEIQMKIAKNLIVVENGEIKTVFDDQTLENGYMPIEEARRLSHEWLNKSWEMMITNKN